MESQLSYEAEEYIEAIYKLQQKSGAAKTKELAEELHVVPGSVTNTIAHLETHDLVEHEPYRGVKLTQNGQKLALAIVRRHRLAERLLTDILGGDWSRAHENACRLEHALTEDVLQLIEKRLDYPKLCPHGNPIPTESGSIEDVESCKLTEISTEEPYIVTKITDERHDKLALLAKKGIGPETLLQVVERLPRKTIVRIAGREQKLNNDDAASVWVRNPRRNNHAV